MDYFYVADSIMVAVNREKGKMQGCKDTFLVTENFTDHWGGQITRIGKILSSVQTVAEKVLFDLSLDGKITGNISYRQQGKEDSKQRHQYVQKLRGTPIVHSEIGNYVVQFQHFEN